MARQTTITIETSSLLILRDRNSRRAWCPQCGAETEMITLEETDLTSNVDRSALEEWLNHRVLHRFEGPDGSALICLNSLLVRVQNANPAGRGIPRLPNTKKERT
jgi:hypothetical protein